MAYLDGKEKWRVSMFGRDSWKLRSTEHLLLVNQGLCTNRHLLVGITRVRNESKILRDTLSHMSKFVDAIVAYDDASTDNTLEILRNCPKVALVVANTQWEPGINARLEAETRHRGLLLTLANAHLSADWILCFDADERYLGNIRDTLHVMNSQEYDGIRIQLFDAYMTKDDYLPYSSNQQLLNFRRMFGPEKREILMLWKNSPSVFYQGLDAREPRGVSHTFTNFYCQHYGKAISIQQWEDTCDYYVRHFPHETYGKKWLNRKGKAIHAQSDFSRSLYEWGDSLFLNAVLI